MRDGMEVSTVTLVPRVPHEVRVATGKHLFDILVYNVPHIRMGGDECRPVIPEYLLERVNTFGNKCFQHILRMHKNCGQLSLSFFREKYLVLRTYTTPWTNDILFKPWTFSEESKRYRTNVSGEVGVTFLAVEIERRHDGMVSWRC